jgi:hypothetical protein
METLSQMPQDTHSSIDDAEESMNSQTVQETARRSEEVIADSSCAHGRLIDDVRTRSGKRTGKVQCLECKAIIEDPYQGLK